MKGLKIAQISAEYKCWHILAMKRAVKSKHARSRAVLKKHGHLLQRRPDGGKRRERKPTHRPGNQCIAKLQRI